MSLATYADLQAAIAHWLARDDLSTEPADFIALAEATLNKVVRNTRMIQTASLAIGTAKSVACPIDMLEPVYLTDQSDEDCPLEQVPIDRLVQLRRIRTRAPGAPKFYAVIGRNVEVTPTPAASTTLSLAYYQAIPALATNSANWLLSYHPDLYLYASLMHAMPFLRADERQQVMGNVLVQLLQALTAENKTATFDPTPAPAVAA